MENIFDENAVRRRRHIFKTTILLAKLRRFAMSFSEIYLIFINIQTNDLF